MKSTFNAFAEATLLKAGDAKTPFKVGGILSTEDRDIDGEILKSVDYSYFTGGFGKVKYEHNEIKGPAAIIGFPTKLIKKGTKTYFEADLVPFDPEAPEEKLTPQQKLAKSTVTLLQHMDEFNKNNPNVIPQRGGWSVEGEYLEKDKKTGLVKARISDVVFTTKPRNKNTIAYVLKSLSAGYGITPETQTGFGATRKESLEGSIKNHQTKGVSKMKTKNDVYKEALQKGMSKEEALKQADEFEKNQNKEMDESFDKAAKSLTSTKEALQKSLSSANEVLEIEVEGGIDSLRKSLKKSLKTDDDGNVEDVGKFLEESTNASVKAIELVEQLANKVNAVAKSLANRAEADLQLVDSIEYLVKSGQSNDASIKELTRGLGILVKGLSGKPMTTPSESLAGAKTVENDADLGKNLSKDQTKTVMKGLISEGKLTQGELENYEVANYIEQPVLELVKSRATDFLK